MSRFIYPDNSRSYTFPDSDGIVATQEYVLLHAVSFDPSANETITGNWKFASNFIADDRVSGEGSGTGVGVNAALNQSWLGDWLNGRNGNSIGVDDTNNTIDICTTTLNGWTSGSSPINKWSIGSDGSAWFTDPTTSSGVNWNSSGEFYADYIALNNGKAYIGSDGNFNFDNGAIHSDGSGVLTASNYNAFSTNSDGNVEVSLKNDGFYSNISNETGDGYGFNLDYKGLYFHNNDLSAPFNIEFSRMGGSITSLNWNIDLNGNFSGNAVNASNASNAGYAVYASYLGNIWYDDGSNLNSNENTRGISTQDWSIDQGGYFSGTASWAANASSAGYLNDTWNDDGYNLTTSGQARGISTQDWNIDQYGNFSGSAGNASYLSNIWYDDGRGLAGYGTDKGIYTNNWYIDMSGNFNGTAAYLGTWGDDGINLESNGNQRGISTPNWGIDQYGNFYGIDYNYGVGTSSPAFKLENNAVFFNNQPAKKVDDGYGDMSYTYSNKYSFQVAQNGTFKLGIETVDDNPSSTPAEDGTITHNYTYNPLISSDVNGHLTLAKIIKQTSLTTDQINAIASPSEGMIVYNSTLHVICFRNNGSWQKLSSTSM